MRDDIEYEALRRRAIALRRAGKSTRQIRETLKVGNDLLTELVRGEPPPEWTRRPNAKDDLRARARELRTQGRSYNEIAATLGVSKSSCSLWLRDMPRPITKAEQTRRSVEARRPGRRAHRDAVHADRLATKLESARRIGALTDRDLILAGAVAYWCEGAKRKPGARGERVIFCNSDPALVELFLRFLDVVDVDRDLLRIRLQIHETADVEEAQRFWADVVGSGAYRFGGPTIKPSNPVTNRMNVGSGYRGCLQISVLRSARLYQRIEGWVGAIMAQAGGVESELSVDFPMTRLREQAVVMRRAGLSRAVIQDRLHIADGEVVDGLLVGEPPSPEWAARADHVELLEDQARDLRAQGWGRRRIAGHLRLPRPTVGRWLGNGDPVPGREADPRVAGLLDYWERRQTCAAVARRLVVERAAREVGRLGGRELCLLGATAYWCEGAKDKSYRRVERVCFINSDAALVRFFISFLESCGVERSRMAVRVHIHQTGDIDAAHAFWSKVVGVERNLFRKPIVKRHEPRTLHGDPGREYHGCLRIDVLRSRELYRKIEGWALGPVLGEVRAIKRWKECST